MTLKADPQAAMLRLPSSLDLKAVSILAAELLAARGGELSVDACEVRRLGAQCLQVLLSAQASWAADGASFRIVTPSDEFKDACALMGADTLCASPIAQEQQP